MTKKIFLLALVFYLTSHFAMGGSASGDDIHWVKHLEALKLSKENPRKIMFFIYADWCAWSKKIYEEVFSRPEIVAYINKHFYAVKINGAQEGSIKFGSKDISIMKYAHLMKSGISSYPVLTFFDENLRRMKFNLHIEIDAFENTHYKSAILFRRADLIEPILFFFNLREDIPNVDLDEFIDKYPGAHR